MGVNDVLVLKSAGRCWDIAEGKPLEVIISFCGGLSSLEVIEWC